MEFPTEAHICVRDLARDRADEFNMLANSNLHDCSGRMDDEIRRYLRQ